MKRTTVIIGVVGMLGVRHGDYIEFYDGSTKVRYRVLDVPSATSITGRKERRWRWLERVTVFFEDMRVTVRS